MRRPQQFTISAEALALLASLFFALFCNRMLWGVALAGRDPGQARTWLFATSIFIALVALHFLIVAPLLTRRSAKPILLVLLATTGLAVHFMDRFNIYLDPGMLRNVLATDPREAGDLLTWSLLPNLALFVGIPAWLLNRVRIRERPLGRAFAIRVGSLVVAALAFAGGIATNFQDLASLMRNNKELRYLVTPGNYLYSLARTSMGNARANLAERQPIGTDAARGGGWQKRDKPVVMVMVLGETARAANWGLSGYGRQTTPELAGEPGIINFTSVTSCGTNTETSVPCIFSPWGRRQYDETRIRSSESLLDVVARAGFRVVWIDNQSGCKGVCAGVESLRPDPARNSALCPDGECLDGALVESMQRVIAETPDNLFIVLHQMGNHGPAYFKRYPADTAHFGPDCRDADLARCSQEEIINAYDNALRYTDHVLADAVRTLRKTESHDAALLYVSDHGESLGENGLYLHGIPYSIAPEMQTRVPMVAWFSPSWKHSFGLDQACLGERAKAPASHDHIFHSLLGLLDVKTSLYAADMDLSAACRPA
jgi:lipid A ethanolaminephosphotransferase